MIDLHKNHQHDDLGFEREDLGGKPVFGFIVSLVTCYHGLAQPLRLEEVSYATVRAVAQSVIACIPTQSVATRSLCALACLFRATSTSSTRELALLRLNCWNRMECRLNIPNSKPAAANRWPTSAFMTTRSLWPSGF